MSEGSARAFVPGHVTVFFSPRWRDDPDRTGSTGAGITLDDGVTVTVTPADEVRVTLESDPIEMAAVERVLGALDATACVSIETDLPIGTGFGVSGAAALGTALAANRIAPVARTENELVTIAHRAEVQAGTGLGDVVAQARGGIPIRRAPGAPGHGCLDGVPATARIEYLAFGEVSTSEVLGDDTAAIEAAGADALERLRESPTVETAFSAGRRFARDAGLLTPRVRESVEDVVAAGGEATMAMLGEAVVALDTGLTDAGYDPARCRVHPAGATLRP